MSEKRYLDRWEGKKLTDRQAIDLLRKLSSQQPGVASSPEHWEVTMAMRAVLNRVPYKEDQMSTIRQIFYIAFWVIAAVTPFIVGFVILVLTCCYSFPTRDFPEPIPYIGFVTVPLALIVDALILATTIVLARNNKDKLPPALKEFLF